MVVQLELSADVAKKTSIMLVLCTKKNKTNYLLPNFLISDFYFLADVISTYNWDFCFDFTWNLPNKTATKSIWKLVPILLDLLESQELQVRMIAAKILRKMCLRDLGLPQSQISQEVERLAECILENISDYGVTNFRNDTDLIENAMTKKIYSDNRYTTYPEIDYEQDEDYENNDSFYELYPLYFKEPSPEERTDFREPLGSIEKEQAYITDYVEQKFLQFKICIGREVMMLEPSDLQGMQIKYHPFSPTYEEYDYCPQERLLHAIFGRVSNRAPFGYEEYIERKKHVNVKTVNLSHSWNYQKSKLVETSHQKWGKYLSDDAGNPCLLERLVAQSHHLVKMIHLIVGYNFILLACAIDTLIQNFIGWIQSIFKIWRFYHSFHKKFHDKNYDHAGGFGEDFVLLRMRLRRFFRCTDYNFGEGYATLHDGTLQKNITSSILGLKLLLETRNQVDQLKKDSYFLTAQQIKNLCKKSFVEFLWSFIPNPMEFITKWRDLFLLCFFVHYTRTDFQETYMELIISHKNIMLLLNKDRQDVEFLHCENELAKVTTCSDYPEELAYEIEKHRNALQCLLQMLCKPKKIIHPHYWSLVELFREMKRMQATNTYQPSIALECERRLISLVNKNNHQLNPQQKLLHLQELQNWHLRYKLQKKLSAKFI